MAEQAEGVVVVLVHDAYPVRLEAVVARHPRVVRGLGTGAAGGPDGDEVAVGPVIAPVAVAAASDPKNAC